MLNPQVEVEVKSKLELKGLIGRIEVWGRPLIRQKWWGEVWGVIEQASLVSVIGCDCACGVLLGIYIWQFHLLICLQNNNNKKNWQDLNQ